MTRIIRSLITKATSAEPQVEECYCGYWLEADENPCPDCGLRRFPKMLRSLETLLGRALVEVAIVLSRYLDPTAEEFFSEEVTFRQGQRRNKTWTASSMQEDRERCEREAREEVPQRWRLRFFGSPSSARCLANLEEAIMNNMSRIVDLQKESVHERTEIRDSYEQQYQLSWDKLRMLELFRLQNALKPLRGEWRSLTHEDCLKRLGKLADIRNQVGPAIGSERSRDLCQLQEAILERFARLEAALLGKSEGLAASDDALHAISEGDMNAFDAWAEADELLDRLEAPQ